jgi:hypothetical protein
MRPRFAIGLIALLATVVIVAGVARGAVSATTNCDALVNGTPAGDTTSTYIPPVVVETRPRILFDTSDLGMLKTRCGVSGGDTGDPQWQSHAAIYAKIKAYAQTVDSTEAGVNRCVEHIGDAVAAAFVYQMEPAETGIAQQGAHFLHRMANNYGDDALDDDGDGDCDGQARRNNFAATQYGWLYAMAYDWLYGAMTANERERVARFMYGMIEDPDNGMEYDGLMSDWSTPTCVTCTDSLPALDGTVWDYHDGWYAVAITTMLLSIHSSSDWATPKGPLGMTNAHIRCKLAFFKTALDRILCRFIVFAGNAPNGYVHIMPRPHLINTYLIDKAVTDIDLWGADTLITCSDAWAWDYGNITANWNRKIRGWMEYLQLHFSPGGFEMDAAGDGWNSPGNASAAPDYPGARSAWLLLHTLGNERFAWWLRNVFDGRLRDRYDIDAEFPHSDVASNVSSPWELVYRIVWDDGTVTANSDLYDNRLLLSRWDDINSPDSCETPLGQLQSNSDNRLYDWETTDWADGRSSAVFFCGNMYDNHTLYSANGHVTLYYGDRWVATGIASQYDHAHDQSSQFNLFHRSGWAKNVPIIGNGASTFMTEPTAELRNWPVGVVRGFPNANAGRVMEKVRVLSRADYPEYAGVKLDLSKPFQCYWIADRDSLVDNPDGIYREIGVIGDEGKYWVTVDRVRMWDPDTSLSVQWWCHHPDIPDVIRGGDWDYANNNNTNPFGGTREQKSTLGAFAWKHKMVDMTRGWMREYDQPTITPWVIYHALSPRDDISHIERRGGKSNQNLWNCGPRRNLATVEEGYPGNQLDYWGEEHRTYITTYISGFYDGIPLVAPEPAPWTVTETDISFEYLVRDGDFIAAAVRNGHLGSVGMQAANGWNGKEGNCVSARHAVATELYPGNKTNILVHVVQFSEDDDADGESDDDGVLPVGLSSEQYDATTGLPLFYGVKLTDADDGENWITMWYTGDDGTSVDQFSVQE